MSGVISLWDQRGSRVPRGNLSVLPLDRAVMYVLPSGRVLRELRFTFETDGYSALNRTAFAEHIAKGRLNQLAYAREPDSIDCSWHHNVAENKVDFCPV